MSLQPPKEAFHITVRDESVPRSEVVEALLQLSAKPLTARDLIAERVRAECDTQLHNQQAGPAPRLVAPGPQEQALNGPAKIKRRDPEKEIEVALAAFEANRFILLINDRQIESLDDEMALDGASVVTFLKLTPLVGG
jgi:hypothetical protein